MPAIIILAGLLYALTPKSQGEQKQAKLARSQRTETAASFDLSGAP